MIKKGRIYRSRPPLVDVNSLIDDTQSSSLVDVNSLIETPKKKEPAVSADISVGVSFGSSKSASAPRSTSRKKPNDDLADYAKNLNQTYSDLVGDFGNSSPIAQQRTGSMLETPDNPLVVQSTGTPLQQKQLRDKEEEDKIRSGDLSAIVNFTNRIQKSVRQSTPKDATKFGIDYTTQDALSPFANDEVKKNIDEENKIIGEVVSKAKNAIDYSVGQEATSVENLDDATKQNLGTKIRKAKSDIGAGEDFEGGNYASDLLKMAYKPAYSLEEIQSHLKEQPGTREQGAEWSKWKHREEDYFENQKNTQLFQYKNEASVDRARMSFYSDQVNDLLESPSVQQYLNANQKEREALSGDADVKRFLVAHGQLNDVYNKRNDVIRKYPQAAVDISRQIMTEAYAEDFMNRDVATPFVSANIVNPVYLKRFFVGQSLDTDAEIKAVAEATGFSEEEVRKQAANIKLPSYAGEIVRGGTNMFASQLQWLNRRLLPANEAEVRNSQIDQQLYHAPKALELRSDNINPETIFRTMSNGAGQFAAFALEAWAGGEVLGALGTGVVRSTQALGEATGLSEGIFANAPKLGRILNVGGEFLSASGSANAESVLGQVAAAGERARTLASTFASGYTSSYEQAYKEAQTMSSDPSKWAEYAEATAFLNGISELVLPDVDVAKRLLAVSGVKNLLRNGAVELSKPALIASYMANLGKVVGQETLEEYIPLIGQTLAKEKIFNYQTSTSDFFKQLWDTTLQTMVSTLPMGVLGAHGSNNSHFTKSSIYEISLQPDKYRAMIDNLRDRGDMNNDVANERKKLINTLADIRSKIPTDKNGNELSESAKIDYVADTFKQRWNEEQKKNTDKNAHPVYDQKIKEAQEGINTILEGNHVEPVEVSTMRDNLEAARAAQPEIVAEKESTTTATGDLVDNILSDIFETDLTTPNASTKSQTQRLSSEEERVGNASDVDNAQSQQERSQETTVLGQPDNSNRTETSGTEAKTLQERLDAARSSIVETAPTMQENLDAARRSEQRRQQREDDRRKRNQIIDEQTQGEPIKAINVTPANASNVVSVINEEPQPISSNEITPDEAERRNVPGVFRFGKVQNIPIEEISNNDSAFRGRRKLSRETIKYFRKNNSNEPVMVYRHNGRIYVLDGRSRLEAKRANRRKTVPVRFFNGTYEEALRYAELQRPAPIGDQLKKRAARVTMNDPQSFEEAVLQAMLSKNGFNRGDFARVMGFGGVNRNRNSMAYGRAVGLNDIKDAISTGMLRANGISFDQFAQDWIQRNEDAESGVHGFGSEQDLMNEIGDIIMRHQTKEDVVNRLEELNGIQGTPLQSTALPFNVTEEEAIYIDENNLSETINSILNNASDIEVSNEEKTAYEDLVRSNASDDGTLDATSVYNQLISSDNPDLISLKNKLSRYATTEEAIVQSVGNTGSENMVELEDEELPFSRGTGEATTLTAEQAKTVGRTLSKAFKGLKVIVDGDKFSEAFKNAIAKFSRQLSEQLEYYTNQLNSSLIELQTAKDELNAKRRQLDRSIAQDQQDLFGGRPSDTQNLMFSERVDLSARQKALKPFEDRVAKAQQRVDQLNDKIVKIARQAPEQGSLFSRIPFQRRLNDLIQALKESKDDLGGVYAQMIDEDAEAVIKFIAEQYHDAGSRQGVIRQFGQSIVNEAARLFPNTTSDDRPLLSQDGQVYGMVYNGDVYLNPNVVRADTPLHEIGGHILTSWAKQNQPELYNKIIAVAKQAPEELVNMVRENYPELSDVQDGFWEEVFSTYVGLDARNTNRAEQVANRQGLSALRQGLKEIWNDFINFLIDKGLFKPTATFNADDFREMSLSDFSNMVGEKMFEGRRLSAPAYDLKSIPEYADLADTDLLHDNWGNPIDVLPTGQQKVADAKIAERNNDIKNNTFKTDPRFQRIGSSSRLTPLQRENLKRAFEMEGQGVSEQDIFLATGWFRDSGDRNFRYELPNDNIRFLPKVEKGVAYEFFANPTVLPVQVDRYYTHLSAEEKEQLKEALRTQSISLESVLDYPELYEAHPELRSLKVSLRDLEGGVRGQYTTGSREIVLSRSVFDPFDMYVVLRHEVQHALQDIIGFEMGANQDVANVYYNRKLNHVRGVLDRLHNSLAWVERENNQEANRVEHANYLRERIKEYNEEKDDLELDKNGWIYFFYRNFAGEREANAVMDRARIPDELRVVTPPIMMSTESAITYGDNLAIKKIASRSDEISSNEHTILETTASTTSLEFNKDGSIKYDKIKQLREEIKKLWNETQSMGITADPIERHRKNMQMYGLILRLAGEYVKSGIKNVSDYFANSEFSKLFGVEKFEDLPDQIKSRITNALQMTQAQRDIVQQQIDETLKAGGDVQKNLQDRLNSVRDRLNNSPEDRAGEKPRMRWMYNERTEKWEHVPFTRPQVDAEDLFREMVFQTPATEEIGQYMSGDTILRVFGEAAQNKQDYFKIRLQDALNHGDNMITTAKKAFGDYYVEGLLEYIEKNPGLPSQTKSLILVSLENDLAQRKIDEPMSSVAITKLQTTVYDASQRQFRDASLAVGYGRLRNLKFNGFNTEEATNEMFDEKERKQRRDVEKSVEANADRVNAESDAQQNTEPNNETIRANAEATEREKTAKKEGAKPKRKKSGKGAWQQKASEKSSLKERLEQLKNDIRDINC